MEYQCKIDGRLMAYKWLAGGFKHFLFSIIYGIIFPIDFHIFQRGRYTTNQMGFSLNIVRDDDII